AYVDGEFEGVERAEVEIHLEGCAACQHAARLQEALKSAVRRAAPAVAPIELRQSVRFALRDEEPPGSRWDAVLRIPPAVGPGAAGSAAVARPLASRGHGLLLGSAVRGPAGLAVHRRRSRPERSARRRSPPRRPPSVAE